MNGGVGTTSGFDPANVRRIECSLAHQELRILERIDIVGDHSKIHSVFHPPAQRIHQCRLPGSDRTGDADPVGAIHFGLFHWFSSKQEITLRHWKLRSRFTGEQFAVRSHFVGLRVDFYLRHGRVVYHP